MSPAAACVSWAVQLPQRYTSEHFRRLLRCLPAWHTCTVHFGNSARSKVFRQYFVQQMQICVEVCSAGQFGIGTFR